MAGELILIVEDNERNLKLVRDLLDPFGLPHARGTAAPRTVLRLAATHHPDLILMDIQLPGLDGVAALGRLRADADTAGIPTIALTAFAMTDDRNALPRRRLRRLSGETDQRPGVCARRCASSSR